MSKVEIFPKAVFGWKPDVVDNGIFFDKKNILYIAGKLLVLFNFVEKSQIVANLSFKGFATCLALAPTKRLAAVAQYVPNQKATVEMLSIPFGKKFVLSAGVIVSNVFFFFLFLMNYFTEENYIFGI
jgi:hypothetical protein